MKTPHFLLGSGLLAGLLTPLAMHAQLSPDLITETYNSNFSTITNGVINKSMMEKAIARSNAGRNAKRGTAAACLAASAGKWCKATPPA